ncbi:AMP-binding protein [Streptomyces griseus]|uniref:AMP-binding protein n=1 Tax=Streptomyces griseus TaxID=1911 RepID=UPI00367C4EE9
MTHPEWVDSLRALPEGARVVIRLPNGGALAEVLLACFDLRLVSVPVHPRSTDAEVAQLIDRVYASAVVGTPKSAPGLIRITKPHGGRPDHEDARGLAFIMFTSGSTGRPKGVMLSRDAVTGNASKVAALHGFSPERPHATCLPLYHVNALMMSLLGTRLTGAPLVLQSRFSPAGYFAELASKGVRTASIVPALLHELVRVRPAWPDSLDYLITAAAPLSSDLAAEFHRLYGPRLRQGYGMTEAVNFSFVTPMLDDSEFVRQYVEHAPPVGLPLPGTEFELRSGEVWLRSPDLMAGYWEEPAITAETIDQDGWLRTNDMGELRDGLLVLRGRRVETFNRGGEKYYPIDIEARWRSAGLSGEFAAVPVGDPALGQEIGLVFEKNDIAQLRAVFNDRRVRPAVATSGEVLTTDTGKLRRREMGLPLAVRRDNAEQYEEILDYARATAVKIISSPHKPDCAQAAHMYNQAVSLVHTHPESDRPAVHPRTAAHECFDALAEFWPVLADGSGSGEEMMHQHRGLWARFNTQWPLVSYAELMADVVKSGTFLHGRVLELGSGVGNTTSLIDGHVKGEFVWSDRVPQLVERGRWQGRGIVFDLDEEPPVGLGQFDTIMATNVLHCVADKEKTLRRLTALLNDGGRLILSEGASPTTTEGTPWALDYLCSLWGGWWDRGGFRTRWEWMAMFEQAGLRPGGFSALHAGRHDLGGVVWASK